MRQQVFNIVISVVVIILALFINNLWITDKHVSCDIDIKLEQPEFLLSDKPDSNLLMEALDYYDIKHPHIVYAQAILETGYFRSRVCREYNNLFGLYDSKKRDYYRFNHWSESVVAYMNCIQYKYKPQTDYYVFLTEIGYAEDSLYIDKLKKIVNKSKNQ